MRILFAILFMISPCFADDVVIPTVYSTNGQVTSTNLNGNFSALGAKINGGLDNDNANTTLGYRFFETRATLPSPGSQGRTVFLTSDNSMNFDTGSTWGKVSTNGILLPSGSAFFMFSGSCPSGSTDVTATYSNKFIKVNSTQLTSSGPVISATTDAHTLLTSEVPALTVNFPLQSANTGGASGIPQNTPGPADTTSATYTTSGGGGGHTHTISSASSLEPSSITAKLCQVN